MTSKDELLFAKRLQEEQSQQLRAHMAALGVLDAARESAEANFNDMSEKGVDVTPEIAKAMAWSKFSGSSQPKVEKNVGGNGGKITDCGRFELVVSDEGVVRVVPVPPEIVAIGPSGSRHGVMSMSKLEMLVHDPAWTANTLNDYSSRHQYWWWPGSWYTYATMLRKVANHRFEILDLFKREQDRANEPPHPATMMPPEQLAEKVMMLQHLQMRRQDLAIELSRLDADIRQELKTLPPSDFMPPDTLDPKSAYALRALQGQRQRLDAMLLGSGSLSQEALKAEGGRLATKALAIATVLVCTGGYAGWRWFSGKTGVETPEEFRTWAEGTLANGITDQATRAAAEIGSHVSGYTPKVYDTRTGLVVREVAGHWRSGPGVVDDSGRGVPGDSGIPTGT